MYFWNILDKYLFKNVQINKQELNLLLSRTVLSPSYFTGRLIMTDGKQGFHATQESFCSQFNIQTGSEILSSYRTPSRSYRSVQRVLFPPGPVLPFVFSSVSDPLSPDSNTRHRIQLSHSPQPPGARQSCHPIPLERGFLLKWTSALEQSGAAWARAPLLFSPTFPAAGRRNRLKGFQKEKEIEYFCEKSQLAFWNELFLDGRGMTDFWNKVQSNQNHHF